jgi:photosystem II stability/assembly factor-like uncharacterized protein
MADFNFDIALQNNSSQAQTLTLFSPLSQQAQKTSKYQFATPYQPSYSANTTFTVTLASGVIAYTNQVAITPAQLVSILTNLGAGTWEVAFSDSINGNVFNVFTASQAETLAIDFNVFFGSWAQVDTGGTFAFFQQISFPDSLTVIAPSSAGVKRSTDNGGIFSVVALPSSVVAYQASFIDPNNGFLVGNSALVGRVWGTTNGGASWTLLSSPAYHLYGIWMFDALNGFAYGENISFPGQYEILQTSNGGASFSTVQIVGSALGFLKFVDASHGFVLQAGGVTDLISTLDGGATWNAIPIGFTANSFDALNANEIWAVGNAGLVRYSNNGGATWSVWDIPTASAALFVQAFNIGNVVVGVTNQMYRTIDSGVSWLPSITIGVGAFLKSFNFRDQYTGIAVMSTNNIEKYS